MPAMLAEGDIAPFLRSRGLSSVDDENWTIATLTGGVSGAVFSADDGVNTFVVKQSLDTLAVPDHWTAPRERILTEARVMGILGDIVPAHSPTLIDVDHESLTITMQHAPAGWTDLKSELLDGYVDIPLMHALGRAIGSVHSATAGADWELPPDDGAAGFLALRIEPFHYTVAQRHPELADAVMGVATRILAARTCLVHGDFSPKNVLVGPRGATDRTFWIIDDEVGHRGDPTFDVAFFLTHLALKRLRAQPPIDDDLSAAASALMTGYAEVAPMPNAHDLAQQIGCLLVARVAGRSTVGYLDARQREIAMECGTRLLLHPERFDPTVPLRLIKTREQP